MGEHELSMARRLYEGVADVPGVTVYGDWPALELGEASARTGVVALNVSGLDSAEVSDALMDGWDIATRPGAHCAPLMHRAPGHRAPLHQLVHHARGDRRGHRRHPRDRGGVAAYSAGSVFGTFHSLLG